MITSRDARPLAVLTTSYPTDESDGTGAFVRGFCRAAVRAGVEVEVLCPERPTAQRWQEEPGIRVVRLPYVRPRRWQFLGASPGAPEALGRSRRLWVPALAFGARLTQAVAARVRRRPFRGIVAHWLVPSALAGILGAPPRLPVVGVAHGSDVHLLSRLPAGRWLARFLLARARALCFVSEDLQDRFARLLPASIAHELKRRRLVQPMGVEEPAAPPDPAAARAALGLGHGPLVLWMGRFVPLKAPERALALAEAMPEVTLLFAGEGPLRPELEERSRLLGPRVRFVGQVSGTEKQRLLEAADALVLTSRVLPDGRTESLPVVALEALVHGVPVVASRVGGLPSLGLDHRALRLVAEGDAAALASAVGAALSRGRLPEPVRSALAARFGWEAVLPRILALLS